MHICEQCATEHTPCCEQCGCQTPEPCSDVCGWCGENLPATECAHEWEPTIFLDASNVEGEYCEKCDTTRVLDEVPEPEGESLTAEAIQRRRSRYARTDGPLELWEEKHDY